MLEAPAAVHELDGQPVEQLGMRRRLALRAEVFAGRHEPGAEIGLPDPVDERPRRRRRVAARPATSRTSGAMPAAPLRAAGCRNAGTPGVDGLRRLEEIAALEHVRRARLLALAGAPVATSPPDAASTSASIRSFASFHSGTVVRQ